MGRQMKSRAEASMRRIVDRVKLLPQERSPVSIFGLQVTREARAKMESKSSGESKGLSKEDILHPYTAKKSTGEMSDLEKLIVALLVVGLLGIGWVVYKASQGSKSDA